MSAPLVTLGMPVYNEAEYIREALDSLLAQTYSPIEIVIADNASTDGTSEIAAEYAAKYPQIRHIRHERNLGQHTNFNALPTLATGTYFAWVSGHDLWGPTFVEEGVQVLETKPECVLVFPRMIEVTHEKKHMRELFRPFAIEKMSPGRRFREVMWRVDCNYVYGLWRRQKMLETRLFQAIPAPDRVFLSEMAIKGTFAPMQAVKYGRMNRPVKQNELEKRRRLMAYIHPGQVFSDVTLMQNDFYRPMQQGFYRAIREGRLRFLDRSIAECSTWLSGVMKVHLFPGADLMSSLVKKILPKRVLAMLMRGLQ